MNQDKCKEILLQIEPCEKDFTVIFSGKASKKVNGLYKPAKAEIILHNRNFTSDAQMLVTALHEYAHHLDYIKRGKTNHAQQFRVINSELVVKAQELGLLTVDTSSISEELATIKALLKKHVELELEISLAFNNLAKACSVNGINSNLVIEQYLKLSHRTANSYKKQLGVNYLANVEFENIDQLNFVASQTSHPKKITAAQAIESPTIYLAKDLTLSKPTVNLDDLGELKTNDLPRVVHKLSQELKRIQKTIISLETRKQEIEQTLNQNTQQNQDQLYLVGTR